MNRKFVKKAEIILVSAIFIFVTAFGSFAAENAASVESAGGRSVVVHDVSGTTGSAEIIRKGVSFFPARGVRLLAGDTLRTTGDYKLYIAVDSSSILRLDGDSEAVIIKAAFGQKLNISLTYGKLFYNVAKKSTENDSLELLTNNVTISIRGTSGMMAKANGQLQHMLFDGVVEVTDGKTVMEQTPGQQLKISEGPASDLAKYAEITTFLLSAIPESVVNEMKADGGLMQRILNSVASGVDAGGNATYAGAAQFLGNITGKKDTFAFSNLKVRPEPEHYEPEKPDEPEDDPLTECPGCQKMIKEGAEGHALIKICECGRQVYECSPDLKDHTEYVTYGCGDPDHKALRCCLDSIEAAKHEKVICSCGAEYCPLDSREAAKHYKVICELCGTEYCAQKDTHHVHCGCGEDYCPNVEADKHKDH